MSLMFGVQTMSIRSKEAYLILIATMLVIFGWTCAVLWDRPIYFEKTGAVIAGTAALFVVLQVVYEMKLEEERKRLEGRSHAVGGAQARDVFLPPTLIHRVVGAIDQRAIENINGQRLRFVAVVAAITFLGEIIHGFGDTMFEVGMDEYQFCRNIAERTVSNPPFCYIDIAGNCIAGPCTM
jgi:hypothetical protein